MSFVSLRWCKITDKLAIDGAKFHSSSTSAQVCFYYTALKFG